MADFIRADIGKLEGFLKDSAEAIKEFAAIRTEFDRINRKKKRIISLRKLVE